MAAAEAAFQGEKVFFAARIVCYEVFLARELKLSDLADGHEELGEWLRLARDASAPARERLVNAVDGLMGAELSLREEELAVGILLDLLGRVELRVRKALAERLSKDPKAHHDLILALANDEAEVAEPVLKRSAVLKDDDLIDLAKTGGPRHRQAIASRPAVPALVAFALVASREPETILTLLHNDGAEINPETMRILVEEAKTERRYQGPLIERKDMATDLAAELYWWMGQELRDRVLARFDIPPAVLDKALEGVMQDLIEDVGRAHDADLDGIADQLQALGRITPYLLIESLRRRQTPLFQTLFSRLANLTPEAVRAMVASDGGESLGIACRAIGVPKSAFATIFLLSRGGRPGEQIVDPKELSRALAFYDSIKTDSATRILRQWQGDPGFLVRSVDSPFLNPRARA
jgi:uncharacterized protein (DUF2336 family)